ncbi:MAG: FAD-binding oxidoreductase [Acidipropionibacterium sp.]|jgi:FAD/FMN-containing dehydrogenase|nr:FAD-binding oxidoreductase [Acidipropionibacterium sp.]
MTIQNSVLTESTDRDAELRSRLAGRVLLAGDPGFDEARIGWNTAIDQRPYAVATARTAEDVVDIVSAAASVGLRVAPQSTGHAAAALYDTDLSDAVLLRLSELRGVSVDPGSRTARVLGGSTWDDVLAAAAPHGLTALHGSAGTVSVVGYALHGGLSFYARAHGLAVNAVREIQLVTADGRLVRAAADEHPDLFWALRGGSGAFGVVVSLVIDLLPVPDVVAGAMVWDISAAREVARAWAGWTAELPETATTTLRILHLPPLPEIPPPLRGRSVVVVDGAILESDERSRSLLGGLDALGTPAPEIDTFARIPAAALTQVHMDPVEPTPVASAHRVLRALPAEAVDAFLATADLPGLFAAELRHLGGALERPAANPGAVSTLPGAFLFHALAMIPDPRMTPLAHTAMYAAVAAVDPWRAENLALTFIDGRSDRAAAYGEALDRLRELKAVWDPNGVLAVSQPL